MSAPELDIRRMEPADLELALEWAAGEGWNPGRGDAAAFREALLDGLIADLGPDDPWWIDAPETNPAAIELASERGLERGFRTARMYRGKPPEYERGLVFGVTTLELG